MRVGFGMQVYPAHFHFVLHYLMITIQQRYTRTDRQTDIIYVLFHRRTRAAAYVYNGCLAWYNVRSVNSTDPLKREIQSTASPNWKQLWRQWSTIMHAHAPPDCILRLSDRLRGINNTSYTTPDIHCRPYINTATSNANKNTNITCSSRLLW